MHNRILAGIHNTGVAVDGLMGVPAQAAFSGGQRGWAPADSTLPDAGHRQWRACIGKPEGIVRVRIPRAQLLSTSRRSRRLLFIPRRTLAAGKNVFTQ